MLYERGTWCLKENENAILRRTERAMVRSRPKDYSRTTDLLGLEETVEGSAKANGVGWYSHELRRDNYSVLRMALVLVVSGKSKRG